MNNYINLKNFFLNTVKKSRGSSDEKLRFQHFTLFLVVGIPIMVIFGFTNLISGNYKITLFSSASAIGLVIGWSIIRHIKNDILIYRINAVIYISLIIYILSFGGEGGSKILWMYTFPLISFFLFGKNEGAVWSLIVICIIFFIFINPNNFLSIYSYHYEFKIRFIASYIAVTAITYWLEYLREYYKNKLEINNKALELEIKEKEKAEKDKEELIVSLRNTIEEVKVLSGLLPICAHCKKIRDDEGYWKQIEDYFRIHADTKFTHSICPECVKEWYPNYKPNKN